MSLLIAFAILFGVLSASKFVRQVRYFTGAGDAVSTARLAHWVQRSTRVRVDQHSDEHRQHRTDRHSEKLSEPIKLSRSSVFFVSICLGTANAFASWWFTQHTPVGRYLAQQLDALTQNATAPFVDPLLLIAAVLAFVAVFLLVYLTAALTIIDIRVQRLPDRIVIPGGGTVLALLALSSVGAAYSQYTQITTAPEQWPTLGHTVGGAICALVLFYVLAIISPQGMGGGDVKLAPVIGSVLGYFGGWLGVAIGLAAGFVFGAVWSLLTIVVRVGGRSRTIPFGPSMFAGAWTVLILVTTQVVYLK